MIKPKPHGKELRKGRVSLPGQAYLLTTVTHDRIAVLGDLWNGRLVVQSLMHLQVHGRAETLAYVVMPDHLHWLMVLSENPEESLDRIMDSLKGYTANRLNRRLGRRGPFWQEGYYDRALRSDEDLRTMARYVVANPLRAGLVDRLGDYPHWDAKWL